MENNIICGLVEEGSDSDEGPVGTQDYISPEALNGARNEVGFASDLWSLGVIVWQIFSSNNLTPFSSESAYETNKKITAADFLMPDGPHVTPEVLDLISRLLVKNPSERLGASSIKDLLEHPLFKGKNVENVFDEEPNLQPRQKKLSK